MSKKKQPPNPPGSFRERADAALKRVQALGGVTTATPTEERSLSSREESPLLTYGQPEVEAGTTDTGTPRPEPKAEPLPVVDVATLQMTTELAQHKSEVLWRVLAIGAAFFVGLLAIAIPHTESVRSDLKEDLKERVESVRSDLREQLQHMRQEISRRLDDIASADRGRDERLRALEMRPNSQPRR